MMKMKHKKYLYRIYNKIYRFVLVCLQISFIGIVFNNDTKLSNTQFINYVLYYPLIIWITEYSQVLAMFVCNKYITPRRIIYTVCTACLLLQCAYCTGFLPMFILFINYIFDLCKNIISYFYRDKNHVISKIFNHIAKPFYFFFVILLTATYVQYWYEFIVPMGVLTLSIYDSTKYNNYLLDN